MFHTFLHGGIGLAGHTEHDFHWRVNLITDSGVCPTELLRSSISSISIARSLFPAAPLLTALSGRPLAIHSSHHQLTFHHAPLRALALQSQLVTEYGVSCGSTRTPLHQSFRKVHTPYGVLVVGHVQGTFISN